MSRPSRPKKVKKLSNIFAPKAASARTQIKSLAQKRVEEYVVRALSTDRSAMTVVRIGLEAVRNCEGVAETLINEFQPTLACRQGCDYCCHPPVSATVAEVANIVAYVEAQLPPEETERLRERVQQMKSLTEPMSSRERAKSNLPCPFLEAGRCSVYPVRPLACRGFNSYDQAICRQVFEHPENPPKVPTFVPLVASAQGMKEGVAGGLLRQGLSTPVVDLVKGSAKLFHDLEGSLERWLEGENEFLHCLPF